MIVFFCSTAFIIKKKIQNLLKTGIIKYIPQKIQIILLKRSIFDLLCDLLFMRTISKYIGVILSPLFFKFSPEGKIFNLRLSKIFN